MSFVYWSAIHIGCSLPLEVSLLRLSSSCMITHRHITFLSFPLKVDEANLEGNRPIHFAVQHFQQGKPYVLVKLLQVGVLRKAGGGGGYIYYVYD